MKKIYFFFPVFLTLAATVYAANTLIYNLQGGQSATGDSSYSDQEIQMIQTGDVRFMNLDNDTNKIGDYLAGYYYDTAHGYFRMDAVSDRVRISSETVVGRCPSTHTGYKLTGFSYSPEFGFMDFNFNANYFVFICIAHTSGQLGSVESSYVGGYAYSPMIGFQNFDDIQVQGSVIVQSEASATQSARQIKILGLASSKTTAETAQGQFLQDVRLVGISSKPELRKKIQQNVVGATKGITNPATTGTISNLGGSTGWQNSVAGTSILSGEGRYFAPNNGGNIMISGENLEGNKTLVVEGGNIWITGNIRGSGILGLVSLEKDGMGGNIYITPSVTDIHAVMYADRSLISYNGNELDGTTQDQLLADQLYIKGSLFSENTLGGFQLVKCPFYVNTSDCSNAQIAAKYDLNYLRRYVLVTEIDEVGIMTKYPQFNANQSFAGGTSRGSKNTQFQEYAVIIEYDSRIQQNTPKIFK